MLLLACVAACDSADKPAADGGEPLGKDAGDATQGPTFDPEVCAMRPAFDGFELVPAAPAILQFVNSPCTKLPPSQVLLVNATESKVRVEAVGTSDAMLRGDASGSATFHASAKKLPRDLEPGESLAVEVTFEADVAGVTASSDLKILTADGCQQLSELQGASIDKGGGTAVGPLAIDFGVVKPGEESKPVAADFTFVPSPDIDSILFTVSDAAPPDVFEVVTKFDRDLSTACAEAHATVKLKAPSEPGVVMGSLFYQLVTSSARGGGVVPLRAVVKN